MKKIKSYLPIFPGFYNTIFEPDEDQEIESINDTRKENGLNEVDFDKIDFDYREYEKDVSRQCVGFIQGVLKRDLNNGINIEFENLYSPKEYNFSNDSINVTYRINKHFELALIKYINENLEDFQTYLKGRFTSYDGFISFYSNDSDIWLNEYCRDLESDPVYIGALLDFYLLNEDEDLEMSMYDHVIGNMCLSATNYDKLIQAESN